MEQAETSQEASQDFKPSRSDLAIEIKGEVMNLNDALSIARASVRFQRNNKPSSHLVFASVYECLDKLVGLSRELLSHKLVAAVEHYLDGVVRSDRFLEDATTYKRLIDRELFEIGLKDTGLRQPCPFPLEFHEEEYGEGWDK